MLPVFALAPLMGLVSNWFGRKQQQGDATEAADRIKSMLGSEPSLMYPGQDASGQEQQGPPQQLSAGSGLMADPSDPRRQLEFANGLMSLRPAERRAAGTMFADIMARAQGGQLAREQLGAQQQEAATREQGVTARFDAQLKQAQEEFADKRKQWGDALALDWYKARTDHILKAQEIAMNAYKLRDLANPPAGPSVQLGPTPAGTMRVPTPDGGVEDVPIPGSDAYNAGSDTLNAIVDARQHVSALRDLVQEHGTEAFGAKSREMNTRHSLAVDALRRVFDASNKGPQAGRYSEARIKDLNDLLANPSGFSGALQSDQGLLDNYDTVINELEDKYKQTQQRTRNWSGINRAPLASAAKAREFIYQAQRGAPAPPRGASQFGVTR